MQPSEPTMTEVNGPHFLGTKPFWNYINYPSSPRQDYHNIVASETNSSLISIVLSIRKTRN